MEIWSAASHAWIDTNRGVEVINTSSYFRLSLFGKFPMVKLWSCEVLDGEIDRGDDTVFNRTELERTWANRRDGVVSVKVLKRRGKWM